MTKITAKVVDPKDPTKFEYTSNKFKIGIYLIKGMLTTTGITPEAQKDYTYLIHKLLIVYRELPEKEQNEIMYWLTPEGQLEFYKTINA